jgi:Uma2 family endonuclease
MSAAPRYPSDIGYNGLRMTADEYLALGETAERYELIDGVVVISPSPFPDHNEVSWGIAGQLRDFARKGGSIRVFPDTDLKLTPGKVYRPDIAVYRSDRLKGKVKLLTAPPDLAIEILSPGSKPLDLITKRDDYEQFGVGEYWAIDPADARARVWRREGVQLVEAPVVGDSVSCAALPGFTLDLAPIRTIARGE